MTYRQIAGCCFWGAKSGPLVFDQGKGVALLIGEFKNHPVHQLTHEEDPQSALFADFEGGSDIRAGECLHRVGHHVGADA